ncbi:MAG TPA: hypothetical protein VJ841_04010 [Candidatus Saccharimonadales bacterium]|nr:hypothetical protein [Candidatus Saccharimonadales bacterium]
MGARERGSAVVILVSVLTLALCVALGILFYQNFVAKPSPTPQDTTDEASRAATPLVKEAAFGGTIYELQYPANGWSATTSLVENARLGDSKTYFDNSDGTVRVEFDLYETRGEDSCDSNSERKIGYISIDQASNSVLTDEVLYLVETIFDGPEGGYVYKIGLTPDGGATHATLGQTMCTIASVGTTPRVMNGDTLKRPVVVASIQFPKVDAEFHSKIPDMKTVKDLLDTDSYKQAKTILLSARKK